MSLKSEVIVLDIFMKNVNCHNDMVDIMTTMQLYLGNDYPGDKRVVSGGDDLTYLVLATYSHGVWGSFSSSNLIHIIYYLVIFNGACTMQASSSITAG